MKKTSDLLDVLENNLIETINFQDKEINTISYDSRLVSDGTIFIALRGSNYDAHNFIPDVIKKGCKLIVCEELPYETTDATFIKVQNSRKALAQISHWWFDYPTRNMKILGVTGTNGKTTTTFVISQILQKFDYKVGIIGTTGIYFLNRKYEATHTTPESYELCRIFKEMALNKVDYVVMEVSSHALVQNRVFGIDFDAAVFTNLTHDHLDYHKTIEAYADAKKILFDNLKPDSIAIINGDSEWADHMVSHSKAKCIKRVGRNNQSDYSITNEEISYNGIKFTLENQNIKLNCHSSLLGKFNIDNVALSVALCLELGLEPNKIQDILPYVNPAEGRMVTVPLKTGAIGIVDYAHTPDALEKALKTCREILDSSNSNTAKIICVFGCGGDRDNAKRPKMGYIATQLADFTIITDDNPRSEDPYLIRKDIIKGIPDDKHEKFKEIGDRAEAIRYAVEISKQSDIVLVAGKGHEKYQIIGKTRLHFDDFEQLKNS